MKLFLVALVGCVCLAGVQAGSIRDLEGFLFENRPRLGHFKDQPFIELYKTYAAAFVKPNHPERSNDDFRNYLPSADECVVFLRQFRINTYVVRDIDEFVVLDACLGYLFDDEGIRYHEDDSELSQHVKDSLPELIADAKLKELYTNTKLDTYSEKAKDCLGELLFDGIRARKQFSDVVCNNHWIEVLTGFAECQSEFPEEARKTDSYMSAIYDLVRERGNKCFHEEITALNRAIRSNYANNPFERVEHVIKSPWSKLHKQSSERIWPKVVTELLSTVQGITSKSQINLREVGNFIRGIGLNDPRIKQKFLENLAKKANEYVKPKKDKATSRDPSGAIRYTGMVDNLCNFFRSSDAPGYYDYSTPFKRMVRILKYPEIFEIDEKYFVEKVLTRSYESAPLYLCVSSCNLLTFTEGAFVSRPQNGQYIYQVAFRPDTSEMVQWPYVDYY